MTGPVPGAPEVGRQAEKASVLAESAMERVRQQVQHWRDELINLSRSNRLLNFSHTKTSTLEIVAPAAAEILGLLASGGRQSWGFFAPSVSEETAPEEEPRVADLPNDDELVTNKADKKSVDGALRILARRTAQEYMDKGLWVLYLGVGMLEWVEEGETDEAHSPLILLPVALDRDSPREPFRLKVADEDHLVNPALAVKLGNEYGITLPAIPEELDELDLDAFIASVRDAIADRPEWKVTDRVVLATFSFYKEVMYRDLLENEAAITEDPTVQALALGPEAGTSSDYEPIDEAELDEKAPPESLTSILDADASQRQCIVAARDGQSFIMDGPPGTGKSQTIANAIVELIAAAKTVLFVSEKAAALEVVHKRVEKAGLSDYLLELHSHKATRREVARALGKSLAEHPVLRAGLQEVDLARLKARRKELSDYVAAVNEVRQPLGQSLHRVLGQVIGLQQLAQAPLPSTIDSQLDADALQRLIDLAAHLSRAWGPVVRGQDFVWRDLADSSASVGSQRGKRDAVKQALSALALLEKETVAAADALILEGNDSIGDARRLVDLAHLLSSRPDVPPQWLAVEVVSAIEETLRERSELARTYASGVSELASLAGPEWKGLRPEDGPVIAEIRSASTDDAPITWDELKPMMLSDLKRLQEFLTSAAERLPVIANEDARGRELLGLDPAEPTLASADNVAGIALMVGSQTPPEPEWLNPLVLRRVIEAVQALEQHVVAARGHRVALGGIFSDSILELDLESLCVRFETVHTSFFAKLQPQYRKDKKEVASRTRRKRADQTALGNLRSALGWQSDVKKLGVAESRYASLVGDRYVGEETDFAALHGAIDVAQAALKAVGDGPASTRLVDQLARGGNPDAQVPGLGDQLRGRVHTIRSEAQAISLEWAERLIAATTRTAEEWCAACAGPINALVDIVGDATTVAGRAVPVAEAQDLLELRSRIETSMDDCLARASEDARILNIQALPIDADWAELERGLGWVRDLRALFDGALSMESAEAMMAGRSDPNRVSRPLDDWTTARDRVLTFFMGDYRDDMEGRLDTGFDAVAALLDHMMESVADVEEWGRFSQARSDIRSAGLSEPVEFCVSQQVDPDAVAGIVRRSILEQWVDKVIDGDVRLKHLSPADRDTYVQEFRDLDQKLVVAAASHAIERCNARRPRTNVGAAGVIIREAEKKKKHMPVRKLLQVTDPIAVSLKPCFMMSPLTVSQFLPSTMRFDVVIFDEASQVRPCDAINCIYRGDQLIVAGDPKQLPPTTFFESVSLEETDEYEEDQLEEFESILDSCKASGALPSLSLRWHYRSQYEGLIAYSNRAFYDSRLVTFPGAIQVAPDLGLELFKVAGVYRRGGQRDNPTEAQKVVERVLYHATHHPDRTVGVVAFSEAQASAIQDALDASRMKQPELDDFFSEDRLDGFFIKNLESVQGDERDIIIFSVGYGPDEVGKLTMQFGPLNKQGGQRRLNVAVTRARQRVEVVSSITAADIDSGVANQGVRHLRGYLDFAEHGDSAFAVALGPSGLDVESPFEAEVLRTVSAWGYEATPQVGLAGYRIDIGVRAPDKPGRYAIGIECDGRMYHSSKVARDRDRLRQRVLEGLGWRLHRIWGPSWYHDRAGQEKRLQAAIEEAIASSFAEPILLSTAPAESHDPEVAFDPVDLDGAPPWTTPYSVAALNRVGTHLEMHHPDARPEFVRLIKEIVDAEGPIAEERVLRRAREAWGVDRAGRRIRDTFNYCVRKLVQSGRLEQPEQGYLCAPGARALMVRVPGDDPDTQRDIAEIPTAELKLALLSLARDAQSITQNELTTSIARVFGWARRGPDISQALERVVQELIAEKRLDVDGQHLRADEDLASLPAVASAEPSETQGPALATPDDFCKEVRDKDWCPFEYSLKRELWFTAIQEWPGGDWRGFDRYLQQRAATLPDDWRRAVVTRLAKESRIFRAAAPE